MARSNPSALIRALQVGTSEMGLQEFKAEQKETILSALCGKDMLVTLPTGFGKSVIYQLLSYCAKDLARIGQLPDFKPVNWWCRL